MGRLCQRADGEAEAGLWRQRESGPICKRKKGVAGPAWKRSGPAKEMMRRPGWAASWVLGWVGVGFGLVWVFCFLLLFSISKQIKSN